MQASEQVIDHCTTSQTLDWKILFYTLLGNTDVGNFEIETTGNQILIKASAEKASKIQQKLKGVLQTPVSFRQSLPYTVTGTDTGTGTTNPVTALPSTPYPEDSVASGKEVLLRFFSPDIFDELGFSIEKTFNENARSGQHVLFSKSTARRYIANAWREVLNALLLHFHGQSIDTLRDIWQDTSKYLPAPPDDLITDDTAAMSVATGLLQQCFGLLTQQNPKKIEMFFNYGRLYEFLFPPHVNIETKNQDEVTLSIDRDHLLSYMQQLVQDSALLRIYKSSDQAVNFTYRPIFFSRKPTVSKPHIHSLIIDKSFSMKECFDELKQGLIEFIVQLEKLDSNATIRLTFFSHDRETKEFPIKNISDIIDHIKSQEVASTTSLFDAIFYELDHILWGNLTGDNNITITLFTDGYNNIDKHDPKERTTLASIEETIETFSNRDVALPKFYTLGFGTYDSNTLTLLAKKMGSPYLHLPNIGAFQQICQHISVMHDERDLVTFFYELGETSHQFVIPLQRNDQPQMPDIIIPMQVDKPLTITYRGDKLIVKIPDPSRIPVINTADKLAELAVQIRSIVTDTTINNQQKIQELRTVKIDILALKNDQETQLLPLELVQTNDLQGQVDTYKNQFRQDDSNQRIAQSARTLASSQQGFMASGNQKPSQPTPSPQPASHFPPPPSH